MTATEVDRRSSRGPLRALAGQRALLTLVLCQLGVGVLLGLIWLAWSPQTLSYLVSSGSGSTAGVVIPAEAESQIAGDGRFVVLTAVAGLVFGLLAWQLKRHRGARSLATLVVSSLLSSTLAMAVGELLAGGQDHPALNSSFHPSLTLHARAALFVQALIAALVYTIFVGVSSDQSLVGEPAVAGARVADDRVSGDQVGVDQPGPPMPPEAASAGRGTGPEGRGADRDGPQP